MPMPSGRAATDVDNASFPSPRSLRIMPARQAFEADAADIPNRRPARSINTIARAGKAGVQRCEKGIDREHDSRGPAAADAGLDGNGGRIGTRDLGEKTVAGDGLRLQM